MPAVQAVYSLLLWKCPLLLAHWWVGLAPGLVGCQALPYAEVADLQMVYARSQGFACGANVGWGWCQTSGGWVCVLWQLATGPGRSRVGADPLVWGARFPEQLAGGTGGPGAGAHLLVLQCCLNNCKSYTVMLRLDQMIESPGAFFKTNDVQTPSTEFPIQSLWVVPGISILKQLSK